MGKYSQIIMNEYGKLILDKTVEYYVNPLIPGKSLEVNTIGLDKLVRVRGTDIINNLESYNNHSYIE